MNELPLRFISCSDSMPVVSHNPIFSWWTFAHHFRSNAVHLIPVEFDLEVVIFLQFTSISGNPLQQWDTIHDISSRTHRTLEVLHRLVNPDDFWIIIRCRCRLAIRQTQNNRRCIPCSPFRQVPFTQTCTYRCTCNWWFFGSFRMSMMTFIAFSSCMSWYALAAFGWRWVWTTFLN